MSTIREGVIMCDCATSTVTRDQLLAEAREYDPRASWEYPGFLCMRDGIGRVLHIGDVNGPWGVDVWPSQAQAESGEPPAESDVLQGGTAGILINHALCVAHRVVTTCADRAYRSRAEVGRVER